jgi:hypothetical protein
MVRPVPSDTISASSAVPVFSDETEIRFAVYAARVQPSGDDVIFLSESEDFIGELRRRSGNHRLRSARQAIFDERRESIVDLATGEVGMTMRVDIVSIEGGTATIRYSMYATPRGASLDTVRLRKVGARWLITDWRVDLVS